MKLAVDWVVVMVVMLAVSRVAWWVVMTVVETAASLVDLKAASKDA